EIREQGDGAEDE
nr:Chain E, GLU-ILE-ARG-GLU-GLN-GLY-ASP-GLY-ALA-GLU-ASP-GLU [Homo sapiens]